MSAFFLSFEVLVFIDSRLLQDKQHSHTINPQTVTDSNNLPRLGSYFVHEFCIVMIVDTCLYDLIFFC